MTGGPLIGRGPPVRVLYRPTLNGGKASDWLRPIPCQWEGDKLPKGVYQSGDGYSTGVHLSEHLACIPPSRREASHVSSQGKEAASVTHDIYVGDGCEAYSNSLFIPARSELTSTDSLLVRHNYFQKFNEEYQDITRYSLIEDLGIVQLTPKEIAKIPDRLMALPKLQFKELKRRLVEIKQPLDIHSNVSFILVMIGGLILCPIIAYVLW